MDGWCTIESDPGVFTELVDTMGVKGVEFEEVYALDEGTLQSLHAGGCYGLVFLFKWRHGEKDSRPVEAPGATEGLFFAKQVISNACATQAILAVLLNCAHLQLGQELTQLKEFTAEMPPELKGAAISNSEVIRTAHNSFARPDPILEESHAAGSDEEVYHFISYVPFGGRLYELDGLQEGPINLGPVTPDSWLQAAASALQERMERYAASEIRFNLMAVVRNRLQAAQQELEQLQQHRASLETAAASGNADAQAQLAQVEARMGDVHASLAAATERHAAWRAENARRRHNYIPFIFNFLKVLAEKGKLKGLIDSAREKAGLT